MLQLFDECDQRLQAQLESNMPRLMNKHGFIVLGQEDGSGAVVVDLLTFDYMSPSMFGQIQARRLQYLLHGQPVATKVMSAERGLETETGLSFVAVKCCCL